MMLKPIKYLYRVYYENIQKYNLVNFQHKWRSINTNNTTIPNSIFPINKVIVGKKCYGNLNIMMFGNKDEKLVIGNYVSIANDVIFLLGGNHQFETFTTYPLYSKLITLSPNLDATTKGTIIIEDEVWIGHGVIILSGVKVGRGAILAAGSVVTKDIPPFAIAGGNPAKIIKYRYSEEIIQSLNGLCLSDFDEKVIIENIKEFYCPLDICQIEKLKKLQIK